MNPETATREQRDRVWFDRIAMRYARKDAVRSSRAARRYQLLRSVTPLLRAGGGLGCVVDVGCGIGAQAQYLRGLYARYVGVDYSAELIQAGREYTRDLEHTEFVIANIKDHIVPAGIADTVLVVGVLHHVEGVTEALKAMKRIAKPGARLVAIEPQRANPVIQTLRHLRARFDPDYSAEQVFFSEEELRSALLSAGLRDVRLEYQYFVTTPFAQVALRPDGLFVPLSWIAIQLDRVLDRLLTGRARRMSWNLTAYATFPAESGR